MSNGLMVSKPGMNTIITDNTIYTVPVSGTYTIGWNDMLKEPFPDLRIFIPPNEKDLHREEFNKKMNDYIND